MSLSSEKRCEKVDAAITTIGNDDRNSNTTVDKPQKFNDKVEDSLTNGEPTRNMSAIKTTGTTTGTRVFPVFSHVKYEHLIAGLSGGVVSTLMLHPLDLIKIRFAGE